MTDCQGHFSTDNGRHRKLVENLAAVPRVRLATLPTPFQWLDRLSEELGGPRIGVVRDDLTGLAFGGNKIRQLEYLLAPAVASGADLLVAGGGARQSNHARACAAAARALGMRSIILVKPGTGRGDTSGNALITDFLADEVRIIPDLARGAADRLQELETRRPIFEQVAEQARQAGARPYMLIGTSVPLGVLGYVSAALEFEQTLREAGVSADALAATSMGATHAGLALAADLLGSSHQVTGMAYAPHGGQGKRWVYDLALGAAELLGMQTRLTTDDIDQDESAAGPGYGLPSPAVTEAIWLCGRTEGLLLDPVYSGKGMAGLIAKIRRGEFAAGHTVVFIHTGGLPALFARPDELLAARAGTRHERRSRARTAR